jgi:hypothetical protein
MTPTTRNVCLGYGAVLFCACLIYTLSCAPGLLWQDSGLIQYRVLNNDIKGVFGLALSHPLFYLLAGVVKGIPVGNLPWRVNMLAALCGAVTVANLWLFVRLWLGKSLPALVAALSLGLAHTFWRHASIAETYTLWTALFTGELILLLRFTQTRRRGFLYALALVNGLALSVHMLASISCVCYMVYMLAIAKKEGVTIPILLGFIGLWIVGASPYVLLCVNEWTSSGDFMGTVSSALFGDRWRGDVMNTSLSWKIVKENILFLGLNFPTPNVFLFLVGLAGLFKMSIDRGLRSVLLGTGVVFLVFAFRYTVADRYAFFIPCYVMCAIGMGVGASRILTRWDRRFWGVAVLLLCLLPIGVYSTVPHWAKETNISLGTRNDIPYRDDYAYFLRPWKTNERSADRFAREVLGQVGPDTVIYADMTTVAALLILQQGEGLRTDVSIVSEAVSSPGAPVFTAQTVSSLLADRPIYLVSRLRGNCPAYVRENYQLTRAGLLWQVQEVL